MLLPPFECCCSDEHGDEFWPSRPVSCAGHGRRPAQPSPFPAGLGGAGRRPHRPHSHWNHVYLQPGTRLPPRRSPGSSLLKREDRHRHQRCVQAKTNVCFSAAAFVPLKQLVLYRRHRRFYLQKLSLVFAEIQAFHCDRFICIQTNSMNNSCADTATHFSRPAWGCQNFTAR